VNHVCIHRQTTLKNIRQPAGGLASRHLFGRRRIMLSAELEAISERAGDIQSDPAEYYRLLCFIGVDEWRYRFVWEALESIKGGYFDAKYCHPIDAGDIISWLSVDHSRMWYLERVSPVQSTLKPEQTWMELREAFNKEFEQVRDRVFHFLSGFSVGF